MVNRRRYAQILLQCFLFEFAAQTEPGYVHYLSLDEIAQAFDAISDLFFDGVYQLALPCDIYIKDNYLNENQGVRVLMNTVNQHGQLFPNFCDYRYGHDDILEVEGLTNSEIQEFLWTYAQDVPEVYQDDIAILLNHMRRRCWNIRGSGGVVVSLSHRGHAPAVQKFTSAHNQAKLDRVRDNDQRAQEKLCRRQDQQEQSLLEEQRRQQEQQRLNRLNVRMVSLENGQTSTRQEDDQAVQFANTLQYELQRSFPTVSLSVQLFGSFANGLSSHSSDLDLTLVDNSRTLKVGVVARALRDLGYCNVVAIAHAKVPIVTFVDWRRNKSCDISINEPLAIENTKLVKTYQSIDPRVRTIWFTLKQIARTCGILSAKDGLLSSYALTLMLITYLQSIDPPILPALQQQVERRMVHKNFDGVDCSFDHNWSIYTASARINSKTAGELLLGFLSFFGNTFNYGLWEVNPRLGQVRTRQANIPISARGQERQQGQDAGDFMCVVDPFLLSRNVAGMVRGRGVAKIKEAFQSAQRALSNDQWQQATNTVC